MGSSLPGARGPAKREGGLREQAGAHQPKGSVFLHETGHKDELMTLQTLVEKHKNIDAIHEHAKFEAGQVPFRYLGF